MTIFSQLDLILEFMVVEKSVWLLPIKLGVMLSLLHLEGRTYRTTVHLQM